jgi:signal transduction histidine kinase
MESEIMRKEIPCVHPLALFDFIRIERGEPAMEQVIGTVVGNPRYPILDLADGSIKPVTREYLFNADNWVSNDLSIHLFEQVAQVVGGDDALYQAGRHLMRSTATGTRGMLLRFMASVHPNSIFSNFERRYRRFNRTKTVQVMKVGEATWAIRQQHFPGVTLHQHICDYNRGAFDEAFGTMFFGYQSRETSCQMQGGPYCEYLLSWRRQRLRTHLRKLFVEDLASRDALNMLEAENEKSQTIILGLERMIHERTAELERKKSELEAANAYKQQFFADASHELRTPLAIAKGKLDLMRLKGAAGTPETARSIATIEQEITRMASIISDLQFLAKHDEDLPRDFGSAVDLGAILLDVASHCQVLADEQGITVSLTGPDSVAIRGDQRELERLFQNLISNAIRYNRPGGSVDVVLRAEASGARVDVKDTGIGIALEEQARIFERFYMVNKNRSREQGGSGLGLAITKAIVEAHGGSIHVHSTVGVGSTFSVWLPTS